MKVKALNGNYIKYHYVLDRDYSVLQDRFIKNTFIALDFLVKHSTLTIEWKEEGELQRVDVVDVLVEDTDNEITIISANKNAYSPSRNTILFYDTHGVVFRKNHKRKWFSSNKGFNSPLCLLSHELIHCYNEIYDNADYLARKQDFSSKGEKIDADGRDLSFPNAEEVFVIKMTNQVAKRLGEDKRSNYGRSYYPTKSVLSIDKKKK